MSTKCHKFKKGHLLPAIHVREPPPPASGPEAREEEERGGGKRQKKSKAVFMGQQV